MRRSTPPARQAPRSSLPARVARTVKSWIAQGTRPRDVLILVRQRGPFFEAVIRALKHEQIEVAGADRLDPDRAHRHHGPDGARRCAAAAGRRSVAGYRAAQPAVRLFRRPAVQARLYTAKARCARRCAQGPAKSGLRRRFRRARRTRGQGARHGAVRVLRPRARRATRPGADFSHGSASKPPIRSMNSSISRSPTSSGRRRRCRASSTGCARRKARSSATWRWRATKCG